MKIETKNGVFDDSLVHAVCLVPSTRLKSLKIRPPIAIPCAENA
jgi:hypothetical protein